MMSVCTNQDRVGCDGSVGMEVVVMPLCVDQDGTGCDGVVCDAII